MAVERTGSNEGAYWDGQWNEFKAAVAEESRQGWTPETVANTLKCDVEAVHAALAEIADEYSRESQRQDRLYRQAKMATNVWIGALWHRDGEPFARCIGQTREALAEQMRRAEGEEIAFWAEQPEDEQLGEIDICRTMAETTLEGALATMNADEIDEFNREGVVTLGEG